MKDERDSLSRLSRVGAGASKSSLTRIYIYLHMRAAGAMNNLAIFLTSFLFLRPAREGILKCCRYNATRI